MDILKPATSRADSLRNDFLDMRAPRAKQARSTQAAVKLLVVSLLVLAAIGLTTEAEASELHESNQPTSTDVPSGEIEWVNDLEIEAEWQRWDGGTIGWQTFGGLALGAAGLFVGAPIGAAIGSATTDCRGSEWGCLGAGLLGALTGTVLGSSAGIQLAGGLNGGDGHYLGTLAGTIGGFGIGLLFAFVPTDSALVMSAAALTTVGGGILGYHLTASAEISGVSVTPTDGGASIGITGRF